MLVVVVVVVVVVALAAAGAAAGFFTAPAEHPTARAMRASVRIVVFIMASRVPRDALFSSPTRFGNRYEENAWCRRWESNPHTRVGRGILSPLRLPFRHSGRGRMIAVNIAGSIERTLVERGAPAEKLSFSGVFPIICSSAVLLLFV